MLFREWQHNHGRKEKIAGISKKCKWASPSEESLKSVKYNLGKFIILNNKERRKKERDRQIINAVVLSVVREYAASYVPKAVMLDLPKPCTKDMARDVNLAELQDPAEAPFEHITVTKEWVNHYDQCYYL